MADRRYDLGTSRVGNTRVETTLRATNEGPTHRHKHDASVDRGIMKACTSAARVDPLKVKSRPDHVWCKVIPVLPPQATDSMLVLPENAKPMFRHRAVDTKGNVILFKQGRGALIRLGDNEEEWISLPLKHVMAYDHGEKRIGICNGHLLVEPIDIPQESETVFTLQPEHVRARSWTAGQVLLQAPIHEYEFVEGKKIIYDTNELTEVVILDKIYHMVHINHVWGVLT